MYVDDLEFPPYEQQFSEGVQGAVTQRKRSFFRSILVEPNFPKFLIFCYLNDNPKIIYKILSEELVLVDEF